MSPIIISPSSLDYQVVKCPRCFYLEKINKIKVDGHIPPVFSTLDVIQQNYFKNLNTTNLSKHIPSGKIMNKDELPGRVVSKIMQDSKGREFILGGRPDIVINFDKPGYGIIDFKTTKFSEDKAEHYRYQLEAYAQIFTNPGSIKKGPTPKLEPIIEIGILQFSPKIMSGHKGDICSVDFDMAYVTLDRNVEDFYKRVELVIDVLSKDNPPNFNENCKSCEFVKYQASSK
tara:strand:+ start:429 stop:1118 length:690 start_codon:yes stop_codon:yes gene_type:complete